MNNTGNIKADEKARRKKEANNIIELILSNCHYLINYLEYLDAAKLNLPIKYTYLSANLKTLIKEWEEI